MTKIRNHFSTALCFACIAALCFNAMSSDFMHGATDSGSTPVDLATVAGSKQGDRITQLEGLPGKNAAVTAIAVSNESITFANPVIPSEKVVESAGKVLRFHVWIKGDGITAAGNLWFDAPTVEFNLYDDFGTTLAKASSLFKTRGTFPWHCYYVDIALPQHLAISGKPATVISDDLQAMLSVDADIFDAADVNLKHPGLYLTLSCHSSEGTATFAGVSYEVLTAAQAADRTKWLDAESGTYAANPEYDELPAVLYFGLSGDQPWNFLKGNQAAPNLLTIEGLKKYIEDNGNDWFHLQKGIAMLPYLHLTASTLELATFEEGWLETLRSELAARQDADTGFWLANGVPNLFATEAIADNCFAPTSLKRADASPVPTPGQAAGPDAKLQFPEKIIDTLLACRVPATYGWNEFALQPSEFGGESRQNCVSLGATTAAMKLLAHAAACLDAADARREEAQKAIRQAYSYGLGTFLLPNRPGLWREDSTSAEPSSTGAFFLDFLNAAAALEHRVNPTLPKPNVEVLGETEKGIRVIWKNAIRKLVAVRIYAAPANVKPQFLTEKNICCFLQHEEAIPFRDEDPLVAARKICDAAFTEWAITPAAVGCDYLASKVGVLPKRLPIGKADKAFNAEPPAVVLYTVADNVGEEDTSIVFYAVGVNAYGECTDYIPLKAEEAGTDF